MIDLSWRFPNGPLRTSFVVTNAVALVALVVIAAMAQAVLSLSEAYPLKAGVVFGVMVLVAAGAVGSHHPFARFGSANQMTTLRAVLVALLASLVGEPGPPTVAATAAAVTLMITAFDGVDGWLARHDDMASDFGARFDMEVDALLIMVLAMLAWQYQKAGVWVLLSGLSRYVFLAAGWLRPWLAQALRPSRRRQAICVVQVAGLNLAIAPAIPAPASALIAAAALAALAYSFVVDVAWLWRQASLAGRKKNPA